MAGAGAKKRLEENGRRLSTLRISLLAALAIHVAFRFLLYRTLLSGLWPTAMLITSVSVGWLCYNAIRLFAAPVYSETGDLIDGGGDLNMRGMCGHYHDVLYISVFAQAASGLSLWFWISYLLVPAYGLYLLWVHVVQPYLQSSAAGGAGSQGPQNETERKRLERTQERADRRRQKSMAKR